MDVSFPWTCKAEESSPMTPMSESETANITFQCQICQETFSRSAIDEHVKLHNQSDSTGSSESASVILEPIIKIEEDDDVIFEGQIFSGNIPKYDHHWHSHNLHNRNFNGPLPFNERFPGGFGKNYDHSFSYGPSAGIQHQPLQQHHFIPEEKYYQFQQHGYPLKVNHECTEQNFDAKRIPNFSGRSTVTSAQQWTVPSRAATHSNQAKYQYEDETEYVIHPSTVRTPPVGNMWSNPSSYVCDLCGNRFESTVELVLHASRYHKIKATYRCDVCFVEYKTKSGHTRHMRTKHLNGN